MTGERLIADGWVKVTTEGLSEEVRSQSPVNFAGQFAMVHDKSRDAAKQIKDKFDNPDASSEMIVAVKQFAEEYAAFNSQVVDFAYSLGMITEAQKERWQSAPYIPFYRDLGWQDTDIENRNNKKVSEAELRDELGIGEDIRLTAQPITDKAIRGSMAPLDPNIVGSLTKAVQAMVRDGMIAHATQRTMRDETMEGDENVAGAVLLPEVRYELMTRRSFLQSKIDAGTISEFEQAEFDDLDVSIKETQRLRAEKIEELEKAGFSSVQLKVKGRVKSTRVPNGEMIRRRLGRDASQEEIQEAMENPLPHEREMITEVLDHGETKTYMLYDPELIISIRSLGVSPMQKIEDFFGYVNIFGESEAFNKTMAKTVVGASGLLRELVTRSPIFQVKNIIRDSMQASVTFGGGLQLIFKALNNVVDKDIVRRAEQAGLGIAVDWSPDPALSGEKTMQYIAKDQLRWSNPIDMFIIGWDGLGRMAKQSEVATRMAVYDTVLAKTGGNAAQATLESMEIINYGRRGSSPMFRVITSMAPFMNGRIQGLDVMYRTHLGRLDAPGLFTDENFRPDATLDSRRRVATILGRGGVIVAGTLLYYAMVHDEEEYKEARPDAKNDWWLIPLGFGLPGIKIPIPFEVGVLYKVIPENIARWLFEEDHGLDDVSDEMARQLKSSLFLDLRPQIIRPILDALFNKDSFQNDLIVPQWMDDSIAASEQFNPYTNMVARIAGDFMSKVPFLSNVDFLSSPMKLEYMMRQYFGTIGSYGMTLADRIARDAMGENIVGTSADFGFSRETIANMPLFGDLFWQPEGGAYQEYLYEEQEKINKLVSTLNRLKERRDGGEAAREYKERYSVEFRAKRRLDALGKYMENWRERRDRLLARRDMDIEVKRKVYQNMEDQRNDKLEEILDIKADLNEARATRDLLFD